MRQAILFEFRVERAFSDSRDRFMTLVKPEANTGCWLWDGPTFFSGYGRFHAEGKDRRAHRVAYEMFRGSIPVGLELDHLCRVKLCVNPDHLEAVTHRVNTLRGMSPHADNARKTHCKSGHSLGVGNLHPHSLVKGGRSCATCARERAARQEQRRKDAYPGGLTTSLDRAFHSWVNGPSGRYVEAEVARLALEDRAAGDRRGEINLYLALVRRSSRGLTKDRQGYACNNSYRAHLARRLMACHPELLGFFETRALHGRAA